MQEEQTAPALPNQQTFQQYLRELAHGALRVVLEGVMREELDALIGVGWGESSPKRNGYRNGFYCRDLGTTSGRIEGVQVPRDREGQFHTQVFERYPEALRSLAEDEEHLLTFYAFPETMHRHIQTTNAIESLFSNVRQRTETSCLTIVWATIQDIRLHKLSVI
jgi:transposase-like protein